MKLRLNRTITGCIKAQAEYKRIMKAMDQWIIWTPGN